MTSKESALAFGRKTVPPIIRSTPVADVKPLELVDFPLEPLSRSAQGSSRQAYGE